MYKGTLVTLRELRVSDAEICKTWINDLEMAYQIYGGAPMPFTVENERDYISRVSGRQNNQNHFAIEDPSGNFIGVCSYSEVNWHSRNCMIGWFIGDKNSRGRGYGTDMIKLLLKICFEELDLHKVSLNAFSYNEKAVRLYDRLGFVREGVFRQHVHAMGRRWDEIRWSMLKTEYQSLYGGEN